MGIAHVMELRPLDLPTIQQLACTLEKPPAHKKARQQTGFVKLIVLDLFSVDSTADSSRRRHNRRILEKRICAHTTVVLTRR